MYENRTMVMDGSAISLIQAGGEICGGLAPEGVFP